MTKAKYTRAVILQSFGLLRKNKRLTDAADEMVLMRDGEEILARKTWKNLEHIEDLSMEYWNLRRLEREADSLLDKIEASERVMAQAQNQRAAVIDQSQNVGTEFYNEHDQVSDELQQLKDEESSIITEAENTKRRFSALKLKMEVLAEEGDQNKEEVAQSRLELAQLKQQFNDYKNRLAATKSKIDSINEELNDVKDKITDTVKGSENEANQASSLIGEANRSISKHRAELGLIENEQMKLFHEVGRFLNINGKRRDIRQACKKHSGLLKQVQLLFTSIQLNRRLVERVS